MQKHLSNRIVFNNGCGKRALGFALILIFASAFCQLPIASASNRLRTSIMGDTVNVDPANLSWPQDRMVAQQVYEGLFEFDYAGSTPYKPVPRLVENYEISDDMKVITLHLRKGVEFHSGFGEMTSQDVVFTLKRHFDPKVASMEKAQLGDVEEVEAVDKYSVKIFLKTPSALTFILNLAWQNSGFVMSRKACEKLGDRISSTPIGTGPYFFVEWLAGEKIVLKKFEKYWGFQGQFDEIEFWIVPNETVALGALEKGDLDVVSITQSGSYEKATALKNIRIVEATGTAFAYYQFINHQHDAMKDLRVRRALAHAIDMEGISNRLGPMFQKWPSPLGSALLGSTTEFWKYEYDVEKAKKLLGEAGYSNGFNLDLGYTKGYLYERVALELANSWKKLGNINVKLEEIEQAVFFTKIGKGQFVVANLAVSRLAPFLYAQFHMSGSPRNFGKYTNPKLDEAIENAKVAKSEEEARFWWREFQRISSEDVALFYMGNQKSLAAVQNDIQGIILTPYLSLMDFDKAYRQR